MHISAARLSMAALTGTWSRTWHCACGRELLCWRRKSIRDHVGREQVGCCLLSAAAPHGDDHAITNVSKQHRAVISPHPDSVFVGELYRRCPIPASGALPPT